jgi:type II secretory pathway component PulF
VAGNDLFQKGWPALVAVLLVAGTAFLLLRRLRPVRLRLDRLKFRMPISGSLYGKIAISRFARVLSMLIRNGVPVVRAMEISPNAVTNAHLQEAARNARECIRHGGSIYEGLSREPIFPPLMTSLIAIGEKTGTLDQMLNHVVAQYEMDVRYSLKNLMGTIEPVVTVIIGVGVLFLGLAIFLPIWSMAQVIIR